MQESSHFGPLIGLFIKHTVESLKYWIGGGHRARVLYIHFKRILSHFLFRLLSFLARAKEGWDCTVNKKLKKKKNCRHIASLLDTIEFNMPWLLYGCAIHKVIFALFCDKNPYWQYCQCNICHSLDYFVVI